jgi:hypothetical protein
MSTGASGSEKIENFEPGDVIAVERGGVERPYTVTNVNRKADGGRAVTFDDGAGRTFVEEYSAGVVVFGSLHKK